MLAHDDRGVAHDDLQLAIISSKDEMICFKIHSSILASVFVSIYPTNITEAKEIAICGSFNVDSIEALLLLLWYEVVDLVFTLI